MTIKSNKKKSLLKWIAWVIVVQLVLINISAALYAYKFTHFYNKPESIISSQNIFSKTWKLFSGPKFYKIVKETEPSFPFENIQLKTVGGLAIHGWYSEQDSSKGCVILFHGITVNKSYLLKEAMVFHELGYNVLMIDFRGHGKSDGSTTSFGVDETEEVHEAFEFAKKQGNQEIILYGMSLGAVVIMKAVADKIVQPAAIIGEMPFGSLQDHLKSRAKVVGFPAQPFGFLVTLWMGVENGYNGFNHKTTGYAKKLNCPVLLQWGENDIYVAKNEIESVYKNIPAQKKLVIYPGAEHSSLVNADEIKWISEVKSFLQGLP